MDRARKSHHSPYHRFGLAIFRDRMPPPPKFTDECGIEIHGVAIFPHPRNLWAVWYRTVAEGGEDNLNGRAVAFIFPTSSHPEVCLGQNARGVKQRAK